MTLLLSLLDSGEAWAQDSTPAEEVLRPHSQVEQLHEVLIQAMQIADGAQREALIQPVIARTFDVPSIARISVGRTWRNITQEQRGALIEDLQILIAATYADRFDAFNQQQFVTDAVEEVKTGHVVKTRLLRTDDDPVSLDYFLRKGLVFNVVADGVSDLSLRRADYNSIIKQQGFEALMRHVSQKIDEARGSFTH